MDLARFLGGSKKFETYFIGEIGINHNGSLDLAKQLIDVCVDADAMLLSFRSVL